MHLFNQISSFYSLPSRGSPFDERSEGALSWIAREYTRNTREPHQKLDLFAIPLITPPNLNLWITFYRTECCFNQETHFTVTILKQTLQSSFYSSRMYSQAVHSPRILSEKKNYFKNQINKTKQTQHDFPPLPKTEESSGRLCNSLNSGVHQLVLAPRWTLTGSILTTLESICVCCICSLFKFKLQSKLLIILIITI